MHYNIIVKMQGFGSVDPRIYYFFGGNSKWLIFP